MGKHSKVLSMLRDIAGESWATDEQSHLTSYNYDIGGLSTPSLPGGSAEFVVLPHTVKQLQEIIKLANMENIPVTPFISGANMGGLAVPLKGGIVIDLHRMNRIIEINEDAYYAVVEPGVSFGMLERELRQRGLWVPVPMAPPAAASVVGNVLLTGIGHTAGKYGCEAELLNGLEAVIPSGEVIRTGSCAISPYWYSRFPIPDLSSLFIGWQGTTGIVTKMGIALFKRPEYQDFIMVGFDDYDEAVNDFIVPWHRLDVGHDCTGITWAFGAIQGAKHPLPEKPKEEPLLNVYTKITGHTQEELDFKRNYLFDFIESRKKVGKLPTLRQVEMAPELKEARNDVPNPYGFLFSNYRRGGGAWVGSFTPAHRWPEALRDTDRIMVSYGVPPATRVSIFRGSHYGMLRCIWSYDSGDPEDVNKMKEMSSEIANCIIGYGGLIYKAPTWLADIMLKKAHPGYKSMMKTIKDALDPNNIMNPGRWGL